MFTGIIESTGIVHKISVQGTNKTFLINSPLSTQLAVDQSISHDGVCLTVEAVTESTHQVTAIEETLKKTTLGQWEIGQCVNLEKCISMSRLLDGHVVQGHVDGLAQCVGLEEKMGSYELTFSFDKKFAPLVIEKGSVCINGISLTAFQVGISSLSVAIIPYTWEHTNLKTLTVGMMVNIEFDVLGKYVQRILSLNSE